MTGTAMMTQLWSSEVGQSSRCVGSDSHACAGPSPAREHAFIPVHPGPAQPTYEREESLAPRLDLDCLNS